MEFSVLSFLYKTYRAMTENEIRGVEPFPHCHRDFNVIIYANNVEWVIGATRNNFKQYKGIHNVTIVRNSKNNE